MSTEPAVVAHGGMWRSWFMTPESSAVRYVVRMGLTSLLPSIVVAIAIFAILLPLGVSPNQMDPDIKGSSPIATFIAVVLFSPALETLLMAAGIGVLSRFLRRPFVIAACSALLWAVLHSSLLLIWGVVIAWPFFVFSCAYLTWRPYGWAKAVTIAMSIHMFQNLLPGLLLLLA